MEELTRQQKFDLLKEDGTIETDAVFYLDTDLNTIYTLYDAFYYNNEEPNEEEIKGHKEIIKLAYTKTYKQLKEYCNNFIKIERSERIELYILTRLLRAYLTHYNFKLAFDMFYKYFLQNHPEINKTDIYLKPETKIDTCIDIRFFKDQDFIFVMLAIYKAQYNKIKSNTKEYNAIFTEYIKDYQKKYTDIFKPTTTQHFIDLFNLFLKELQTYLFTDAAVIKTDKVYDLLEKIKVLEQKELNSKEELIKFYKDAFNITEEEAINIFYEIAEAKAPEEKQKIFEKYLDIYFTIKDYKKQIKKQNLILSQDYISNKIIENIQITEHTSKDYERTENKKLKYLQKNNIKEDAERSKKATKNRNIINKFRKENPDTEYTDDEILQIKTQAKESTIFNYMHDLGLDEELQKVGISFETIKDSNKEKTFIKTNSNTLANIMNIEDTQIYNKYGKNTLELKKFIEAQVFTFFRNNNINNLTPDLTLKINPQQYNEFRHLKKDIFLTKEEIKDFLFLLSDTKITINNKDLKKGNVWKTPEDKIYKNNKLSEETKQRLIKQTHKITIVFNLIQHYIIDKDTETNQETYFIKLTETYINYLQLVYLNNFFIKENTPPIKPIENKPNSRTPERAKAIKDTILFYMKNDKGERPTLKDNNYTKYTYKTTIEKLKNILLDANYLNINKLQKDGYTKTIKEPIKEALVYLLDNGNIDIYPPIDNIFIDNKATKQNIQIFEAKEILLTLKNNYESI